MPSKRGWDRTGYLRFWAVFRPSFGPESPGIGPGRGTARFAPIIMQPRMPILRPFRGTPQASSFFSSPIYIYMYIYSSAGAPWQVWVYGLEFKV